ncbi:blue copper protein-like [Euphorbia lathyris]|uniref:blue copper protein-like n=1 Tax=Euphorbia lathyris TaxID=212925 RepID=UPI0033131062
MSKISSILILAIAVAASLVHSTAAKTFVVGDDLGWLVPPGGDLFYATWAAVHIFTVGDVLLFNFTSGVQDVARVSKEAFLKCNSTDFISVTTSGPVNITLNTSGEYFFISTMDKHCFLGQRLAIYVIPGGGPYPAPGPVPVPVPHHRPHMRPDYPMSYSVGDGLGWIVPPGGSLAYMAWAYNKTFIVGDTLVFNFVNGVEDVALVSKDGYESCNTNSTIQKWLTSPTKVLLNASGDYFFTSTYPGHCILGQQLAITVVASGTDSGAPSSSSPVTDGPTAAPPPFTSASSLHLAGFSVNIIIMTLILALF